MSEHIRLNITGMKCGGCVSAVEEALKNVDAVDTVEVSLDNNQAVISGAADIGVLIEAVEAAGFKAEQ